MGDLGPAERFEFLCRENLSEIKSKVYRVFIELRSTVYYLFARVIDGVRRTNLQSELAAQSHHFNPQQSPTHEIPHRSIRSAPPAAPVINPSTQGTVSSTNRDSHIRSPVKGIIEADTPSDNSPHTGASQNDVPPYHRKWSRDHRSVDPRFHPMQRQATGQPWVPSRFASPPSPPKKETKGQSPGPKRTDREQRSAHDRS